MIIECKYCHQKFGEPFAVGLLLTGGGAAIITGILCGVLGHALHGWTYVIALPLWFALTWIIWEVPRWITTLRYACRRCSNCGARDWERPDYGGFGL